MSLHVIVGAGPAGTATALRLAGQGQTVRLVSRAGTGPAAARPTPTGQALTATVTWWHDQGRTAADKE